MDLPRILREIAAYERTFRKWETRGDKVIKRYTGEQVKQNAAQFNIFWANAGSRTQTRPRAWLR
jgi:hypothetical protein